MPVIKSEKKKSNNPVIIAPAILVAANVIPRRIKAVSTVPKMPNKTVRKLPQQFFLSVQLTQEVKAVIPRYTTAIPNNTHKKAGVIVISALKRKNAANTPMIVLTIIAFAVQSI